MNGLDQIMQVLLETILYSAVSDGMIVSGMDGRIRFVNAAARRMAHVSDEARLEGETLEALGRRYYPDHTPMPESEWPMMKALVGKTTEGEEIHIVRDDGSFYQVLMNCYPLRDGKGHIIGAYSIYMDITERTALENTIRERENLLASILDILPVGVVAFDRAGNFLFENNSRQRIWGISGCGLPPFERLKIFWAASRKLLEREEWPILKAIRGETSRGTFRIETFDGASKIVEIMAIPFTGAVSSRVGAIGIIEDITERYRTEQESRELKADLERRVRERTAQLAEVNSELEAFSYSVSHDLRAPLRNIYGFTQLLLRKYGERGSREELEYLERVKGGVEKLNLLIEDLLKLSRIGRTDLKHETVDLSGMVKEILDELRNAEPDRGVRAQIQEGVQVMADTNLLHVAIDNVVRNAWKFTAKKDEAVIEFGTVEKEGSQVIYLRDNGAGFDPSQSEHLFKPFQRLHAESEFPGTGIGLAIVKRIIDRHGGRVWAEGAPEQGATIYFTVGSPAV